MKNYWDWKPRFFFLCLSHANHRNSDVFYFQRTDRCDKDSENRFQFFSQAFRCISILLGFPDFFCLLIIHRTFCKKLVILISMCRIFFFLNRNNELYFRTSIIRSSTRIDRCRKYTLLIEWLSAKDVDINQHDGIELDLYHSFIRCGSAAIRVYRRKGLIIQYIISYERICFEIELQGEYVERSRRVGPWTGTRS